MEESSEQKSADDEEDEAGPSKTIKLTLIGKMSLKSQCLKSALIR